jgi:hypothetical protein
MAIGEKYAREQLLRGRYLNLSEETVPLILNHIDCFISQCQGNKNIEEVYLWPRAFNGHGDIWEKVRQALGNLQSLKRLTISTTMAHHESLTDLLRLPSLRSVSFYRFVFTTALCRATANALMEGTAVTKLEFSECSFLAGGCAAIMASGFSRNTSLSLIQVVLPLDQALCNALASALPYSTLRHLELEHQNDGDDHDLSPFFLALGQNTGLKSFKVNYFGSMDESLCTAMKDGLEMNETLESLELNGVDLTDDNSALWCRAFAFLRVNKALKSLLVDVKHGVTESCISAFRIDIATLLQENASLESLTFKNIFGREVEAEDYLALVTALQHNTTLKSLIFRGHSTIRLTTNEDKQIASLLKKNYALERLPDIDLENEAGDVGAILRLNRAGRRYLVQDGSSISKGIEVLSEVNNEINCIFLHLLENPRLCDRSAVEILTGAGESNGMSTSPDASSGGGGKREQASTHNGKESRRRLA